ncbi:6691_t:CDS:2 [Funneliformis mosseae]|uniref:6691_t:CDS:1 n=1 Tax=Funneliformis mosseae TaxID=27381 RepID=A0A9N9GXJ9_FUNMO|nr:6691_t:CDS:2 [Funneliformis mosseae]
MAELEKERRISQFEKESRCILESVTTRINNEVHGSNFLRYHSRRSQAGARYFDEFRSHFWEIPEDLFNRIRNMNISNCRCSRRGSLLVPSIEMVERALSQKLFIQRSQKSQSNQRNYTRLKSLSRNEDGNTENPAGGDNITTSSVQQPSYEANQQSSNSADDEVTLRPGNNVGQ